MAETRQYQSEFAAALQSLFDDAVPFTRNEWAQFLKISEHAIADWVADRGVPRGDLLEMTVDLLKHIVDIPQEPLENFEKLAAKPARGISPLGTIMEPNVATYMQSATITSLGESLRILSSIEYQTHLLQNGTWYPDMIEIYTKHKRP